MPNTLIILNVNKTIKKDWNWQNGWEDIIQKYAVYKKCTSNTMTQVGLKSNRDQIISARWWKRETQFPTRNIDLTIICYKIPLWEVQNLVKKLQQGIEISCAETGKKSNFSSAGIMGERESEANIQFCEPFSAANQLIQIN